MEFFRIAEREYARFPGLARDAGLVHAFSLRPRDMSPRRDERQAQRAAARAQMAGDLGLAPEKLCICEQVHQDHIEVAHNPAFGRRLTASDGAVTAAAGVPLMSFSADCPLILLYDPTRRALGLVHASWRCTVAQLAKQAVGLMQSEFGCRPAELRAGIGPGAGACCYEVQEDVFEAAGTLDDRERLFEHRDGRLYFDLWQANRAQLCAAGLRPENVEIAGVCTLCRPDLFFSFRREGAGCGHFGLMAALRG